MIELPPGEEFIERIEANCRRSFAGIFSRDFDYRRLAREFVSESRCIEQLELLARMLPVPLGGKRLLEIGSGYGMLVATARRRYEIEAFGVEPGEQFEGTFGLSQVLLSHFQLPPAVVVQGTGEAIPYGDEEFDIVYSCNVLEHVADPARVFVESLRVLKPGGHLVFNVPNYGSWWEGHYGVLFPPHCPKWLFKTMMRVIGRDPTFVDTLQFVTYGRLRSWLAPHTGRICVLTYGTEVWEERLRSLVFSEWASLGTLKQVARWVHRMRLVEPLIWLGRRLHWETPFILVVEKT